MGIGIMFLPMTVLYFVVAIEKYREADSKEKRLILFCALPFAVLVIPFATAGYILYVTYIFLRRCKKPDFDEKHNAEKLKLYEAVGEANLQAVLGWFTFHFQNNKKKLQ